MASRSRSVPSQLPVHVEVRVSRRPTRFDEIYKHVHAYLLAAFDPLPCPKVLTGWHDNPILARSVDRIATSELPRALLALVGSPDRSTVSLPISQCELHIHVYEADDTAPFTDIETGGGDEDGGTTAASVSSLPCLAWEGLWDSLIYTDDVKMNLLDYIYATVVFSDADVDFNVVSWNRVVLLHGPPGTGKTSLCRALAQKLAIRLADRYGVTRLLEVNAHSCFSRWFSESGKLVQRLFSNIHEMVDEEDNFIIVLIDEVESLTASRAGAMAGTEPSDGLRVVNALLTQLDKLKHRKNVLVMSTSNLVKAIDSAFVDRADIVQYIDLPPTEAVYEILRTCLCELVDKRIVRAVDVPALEQVLFWQTNEVKLEEGALGNGMTVDETKPPEPSLDFDPKEYMKDIGNRLHKIAARCREQNMSGRALRRLPVLACARYIGAAPLGNAFRKKPTGSASKKGKQNGLAGEDARPEGDVGTPVEVWLDAMDRVVESQGLERSRFD